MKGKMRKGLNNRPVNRKKKTGPNVSGSLC